MLHNILNFFQNYFGTKLQRTASFVTLIGLGLITVSFNEVIMKYALEPIGFSVVDRKPVWLGLGLVFLGLLTLILDKYAERLTPTTFEQDKNLVEEIRTILPWGTLDSFLNNISNLYYIGEEGSAIFKLERFLSNQAHTFENEKLDKKCRNLRGSLNSISQYMGQNFVGPEPPGSDYFKWIVDRRVEENGQHSDLYWETIHELTDVRSRLEEHYIALIDCARAQGMLTLEKV